MNRLFAFVLGLALAFGVRTAWTAVVTHGSDLASGDIGPALLDPADEKIRYSHQRPTTLITTNTVTFVGGDTVDLSGDIGAQAIPVHGANGIYFSGTTTNTNTSTVTDTNTNTVTNTNTDTNTLTLSGTQTRTQTASWTGTGSLTGSGYVDTKTNTQTVTFPVTQSTTATTTNTATFSNTGNTNQVNGSARQANVTSTTTGSVTVTVTGTSTSLTATAVATVSLTASGTASNTSSQTGTYTYTLYKTSTGSGTRTKTDSYPLTETATVTFLNVVPDYTATASGSGVITQTLTSGDTYTQSSTSTATGTSTSTSTRTVTSTSTATATATTTDLRYETTILPPPVSTSLVSTLGFQRSTSAYSTVGVPSCIATNVVIPMDAGVSFMAHAEMYGSDNSASTSCGVAIGTCSAPSAYSYASPSTVYWNASSDYQATMPTCGLPADQNVSLFVCSYGGAGTCTTIAESLRITNQ